MGIWYRAGTISVANGSATVTGLLTTWLVYVRPGDGISFDGGAKWYEVLSVDSNTQITLAENFAETTISAGSYVIDNRSYRHQIETEILETMRQTLAGQTQVIETSGPPSSTIGADKSIAFDPDARAYYHKSAGSWGDAISLGGADGVDAGFQFAFDGSVSMADPGLGKLRFNNATFASITAIAIDDASNDIGNPDVSAYVTTWGASTSSIKGTLIVRKVGSSAFCIFAVTGLTDNLGWTQLAVTPIASGGTINAADQCAAAFIRTGDKGTAGTDGANAGFLMTLDRATTTMVDPGSGKIKFNNAAFNSTTALAISDLSFDSGNPDVSAAILAWVASTNAVKGQVRITKVGSAKDFVVFDLTGLTDDSGWTQLALAFKASGGTLATNDVCVVTFSQAGNKGVDGTNGVDGISAGLSFSFSTTTTMADPGAGNLRFDNATPASVTSIAISDLSAAPGNPDVSVSVLSWDGSTNTIRGTVRISKQSNPAIFAEFNITGATTDNSGWSKLAVTLVSSAGTLSNADMVGVVATRAGDAGQQGPAGGIGTISAAKGTLPVGNSLTFVGLPVGQDGFVPVADSSAASGISWKPQSSLSITSYGAVGDNSTDNTTAINNCIADAAVQGRSVFIPDGIFRITSLNNIPPGVSIIGNNRSTSIIRTTSATSDVLKPNGADVQIRNLQIDASVARTAGYFINPTTNCSRLIFQNLALVAPFNGIHIPEIAIVTLRDIDIQSTVATTGSSIIVDGGWVVLLDNVVCRNSNCFAHLNINHVEDITTTNCQFIQGGYCAYISPGSAQHVGEWLSVNTQFDAPQSGQGIRIAPRTGGTVNRVFIANAWINHTSGIQNFLATNAGGGTVNGVSIKNSILPGVGNGTAIDLSGVTNISIEGVRTGSHDTGINIANSTDVLIRGNHIGGADGYSNNTTGISLSGSSDQIIITGNDLRNNTTPISNSASGASIITQNNLPISSNSTLKEPAVAVTSVPTTRWNLDFDSAATTVNNGVTIDFVAGSGLLVINEKSTSGSAAMFLVAGGNVTLIGQTSSLYVASASPASGQVGVYFASSAYHLKNNSGANLIFGFAALRTRSAV